MLLSFLLVIPFNPGHVAWVCSQCSCDVNSKGERHHARDLVEPTWRTQTLTWKGPTGTTNQVPAREAAPGFIVPSFRTADRVADYGQLIHQESWHADCFKTTDGLASLLQRHLRLVKPVASVGACLGVAIPPRAPGSSARCCFGVFSGVQAASHNPMHPQLQSVQFAACPCLLQQLSSAPDIRSNLASMFGLLINEGALKFVKGLEHI